MDRVETDIVMRVLDDELRDEAKDRLGPVDDDVGFSVYDMVGGAADGVNKKSVACPSGRKIKRGPVGEANRGAQQSKKRIWSALALYEVTRMPTRGRGDV